MSKKFPNIWKQNNTLLKNPWVKEIKREIRQYFKQNINENTTYPNFWMPLTEYFGENFKAIITYIKKEERSHILP